LGVDLARNGVELEYQGGLEACCRANWQPRKDVNLGYLANHRATAFGFINHR
jgi:hypothetical protein